MFFTCKVRPSERLPVEIKHLVFMEEVWRYTAPKPDYLADEYKCHLFYSTRPNPAYYVVDIDYVFPPPALTGLHARTPAQSRSPKPGTERVAPCID